MLFHKSICEQSELFALLFPKKHIISRFLVPKDPASRDKLYGANGKSYIYWKLPKEVLQLPLGSFIHVSKAQLDRNMYLSPYEQELEADGAIIDISDRIASPVYELRYLRPEHTGNLERRQEREYNRNRKIPRPESILIRSVIPLKLNPEYPKLH